LEINQDLNFERKQFVVERIGWILMLALVVAALAGAFGRGPLSTKTERTPDGTLSVEYERFARHEAETELKLHISKEAARSGSLRLWLDRDYMSKFGIKEINPEPQRSDLGADRVTFVYPVPKPGGRLTVRFLFEATEIGNVEGAAGIEGHDTLRFKQFVYP